MTKSPNKLKMELSWTVHYFLEDLLGINLFKVDPTNPKGILSFEEKLYLAVKKSISKTETKLLSNVKSIINNAKFKTFSDSEIEKILSKVNKEIVKKAGALVKASLPPLVFHREKFYKLVKKIISEKLNVNPIFALEDKKALKRLGKFDKWWVGKHYKDGVTKQIFNLMKKKPATVPLARRPLANYLYNGVKDVTKSKAYWEMFSSNALNRARSYGNLRTFIDNEILEYEILAVRDERTSAICQELDGTTMSVDVAIKKWERIDTMDNPDNIKELMRWGGEDKDGAYVDVDGKKQRLRGLTGPDLQAMGLDAPPYHGGCRTTVIPVF